MKIRIMINLLKFMIYKLYRVSIKEQDTVYPIIGFLIYLSIFEILHFTIIAVFFKLIGFEIILGSKDVFGLLFIVLGSTSNYIIFIKNKRIYKINQHFEVNRINNLKGNLIFITYIFILLGIIFLEAIIYKHTVNGL